MAVPFPPLGQFSSTVCWASDSWVPAFLPGVGSSSCPQNALTPDPRPLTPAAKPLTIRLTWLCQCHHRLDLTLFRIRGPGRALCLRFAFPRLHPPSSPVLTSSLASLVSIACRLLAARSVLPGRGQENKTSCCPLRWHQPWHSRPAHRSLFSCPLVHSFQPLLTG